MDARKVGKAVPELAQLAAERRELREARKRLHPPGTIPLEASEDPGIAFKMTQLRNDESSDTLMGIPVSPGTITEPASVINNASEFGPDATWVYSEPCALWPFFKTSRRFKNPLAT